MVTLIAALPHFILKGPIVRNANVMLHQSCISLLVLLARQGLVDQFVDFRPLFVANRAQPCAFAFDRRFVPSPVLSNKLVPLSPMLRQRASFHFVEIFNARPKSIHRLVHGIDDPTFDELAHAIDFQHHQKSAQHVVSPSVDRVYPRAAWLEAIREALAQLRSGHGTRCPRVIQRMLHFSPY